MKRHRDPILPRSWKDRVFSHLRASFGSALIPTELVGLIAEYDDTVHSYSLPVGEETNCFSLVLHGTSFVPSVRTELGEAILKPFHARHPTEFQPSMIVGPTANFPDQLLVLIRDLPSLVDKVPRISNDGRIHRLRPFDPPEFLATLPIVQVDQSLSRLQTFWLPLPIFRVALSPSFAVRL